MRFALPGAKSFEEVLLNVRYKPGANLSVKAGIFIASIQVPNKQLYGTMTSVSTNRPIPLELRHCYHTGDILKWIHRVLMELERHEMDEWFSYHGKPVYNPHPQGGL